MNRSGIYNLEEFAVTNELQTFGPGLVCNWADRKLLSGIEYPGKASSFYMIVLMVDGWETYQLKTTEKTISEIADELNFNDQSALTNFFRTKAGMSPLSYRKKHL